MHPYKGLEDRAFWGKSVSSRHYEDMEDLWRSPYVDGSERIATGGSCFAQHIGRHVISRSPANFMDLEPAPAFIAEKDCARFGYGIYSCRYGNIYTSRQLLQLAQEAFGKRPISRHVWERGGRYFDAVRPSVDPVGHDSGDTVTALREKHLRSVKEMFESLDIFVFTLGLTETWVSPVDGTVFPSAPGVIAGDMEKDFADFKNLSIDEIRSDLREFWALLCEVNPSCQMILTVSPVPLVATASGHHVLTATTYSKSVLRVAAQEMSESFEDIHYFPSYEIVNSPQGRGYYFDPDLRSVNDRGVQYVMSHFFTGDLGEVFPEHQEEQDLHGGVVCDEERIEEATGDD